MPGHGAASCLMSGAAQVGAWIVFSLMLLGVMILAGGPLGFLLWLATLVIASMIAGRYREAERRMLLWSLQLAAEKGFPLPDATRAFARERGGGIGRRASRLGEALESGLPLDAALAASGARLSTGALVAVAALAARPGNWRSRCWRDRGRRRRRYQGATGRIAARLPVRPGVLRVRHDHFHSNKAGPGVHQDFRWLWPALAPDDHRDGEPGAIPDLPLGPARILRITSNGAIRPCTVRRPGALGTTLGAAFFPRS